jgi:hypothetical protein
MEADALTKGFSPTDYSKMVKFARYFQESLFQSQ